MEVDDAYRAISGAQAQHSRDNTETSVGLVAQVSGQPAMARLNYGNSEDDLAPPRHQPQDGVRDGHSQFH